MASTDLKNTYYSIPIKTDNQKFLCFKWDEDLYELTSLYPMVDCVHQDSPLKYLKPPLATLHRQHTLMTFIYKVRILNSIWQILLAA